MYFIPKNTKKEKIMALIKQKVYLITEQQRDGLLNYLLNRPYKEVAAGVEFLNNAPTTTINVEVPEEVKNAAQLEESQTDVQEKPEIQVVNSETENVAVFQ